MFLGRVAPFLFTLNLIAFLGCEQFKPQAIGLDDEIFVFADSTIWTEVESHLREALERRILTPQPEKVFNIRHYSIGNFEDYKAYKNLMIVAPLSSEGPTARFIGGSLSPQVRALVESGEEFVINKYDLYRRNQIVMFLTANTLDALIDKIRENSEPILYYFKKLSLQRELDDIYADVKYEQTELKKRFLQKYAWTMFIQADYWVAVDSSAERYVWLRRANPADMERWIFVYWIDDPDPAVLNQGWVFKRRNELTKKFYRTVDDTVYVKIADDFDSMRAFSFQEIDFLGRYALEMRGLWRFSDRSGGGPFVNYTFYDEPTRRIYMIDGSISAPRSEKKRLILQLEALVHTFQTIHDLTDKQEEKLLQVD